MFGETSTDRTPSKRPNSEREQEEEESDTDTEDPRPSKIQRKMPSTPEVTKKEYATQVVILEGVDQELKKHPIKLSAAFKKCKPNVELRNDGRVEWGNMGQRGKMGHFTNDRFLAKI